MLRTRRDARIRAFQLLYQLEIQKEDPQTQIQLFVDHMTYDPKLKDLTYEYDEYPLELGKVASDQDKDYVRTLVSYVSENKIKLDDLYVPFLKGWKLDRIPIIDRSILRLATYEITKCTDIPFSVSVNEAILLAKMFSNDGASAYINAVLGKLDIFACEKEEKKKLEMEH